MEGPSDEVEFLYGWGRRKHIRSTEVAKWGDPLALCGATGGNPHLTDRQKARMPLCSKCTAKSFHVPVEYRLVEALATVAALRDRAERAEGERDDLARLSHAYRNEYEAVYRIFIGSSPKTAAEICPAAALTKGELKVANRASEISADLAARYLREADECRAVMRQMVQECVDEENEGFTPDGPGWETVGSYMDGTVTWTPRVNGETLRRFIAAAALTKGDG
jgi:hypothetical protein